MNRRDFLKTGGLLIGGAAVAGSVPVLTAGRTLLAGSERRGHERKWGMAIDTNRCSEECKACEKACRHENNVAHHGDARWDVHLIRKVEIRRKPPAPAVERSLPLLCNHCDNPPCAQACPVQATYKRPDGIVIVDQHRCIGCRYCMIACPYNARYFNYKEDEDWPNKDNVRSSHGVPQSCNLCAHRLDRGLVPACVEACANTGRRAMLVGNINDPKSEISKFIAGKAAKGLREDLGTAPTVFYLGL
ncbi:MAG: sulfate reduction electron transfer complex DsrMKJOP subunit DsrO [Planctomycetota bacterium]|jgi:molybdopterin-containing oxidoreductase family iron-sulfur binding subunit